MKTPEITPCLTFIDLLNNLIVCNADGDQMSLVDALNYDLETLGKSVTKAHKKGELVLKVTLDPDNGNGLFLNAELKLKQPQSNPPLTPAYTDSNGRLYAEDPYQSKLDIASVSKIKA